MGKDNDDLFESTENLNAIPYPKRSTRGHFCVRCLNHGVIEQTKGHTKKCPRKLCNCQKCCLVTERQKVLAARRKQKRVVKELVMGGKQAENKDKETSNKKLVGACASLQGGSSQNEKSSFEKRDFSEPGKTQKATLHYLSAAQLSANKMYSKPIGINNCVPNNSWNNGGNISQSNDQILSSKFTTEHKEEGQGKIFLKRNNDANPIYNSQQYFPKPLFKPQQGSHSTSKESYNQASNFVTDYWNLDKKYDNIKMECKNQEENIFRRKLDILSLFFPEHPRNVLETLLILVKGKLLYAIEELIRRHCSEQAMSHFNLSASSKFIWEHNNNNQVPNGMSYAPEICSVQTSSEAKFFPQLGQNNDVLYYDKIWPFSSFHSANKHTQDINNLVSFPENRKQASFYTQSKENDTLSNPRFLLKNIESEVQYDYEERISLSEFKLPARFTDTNNYSALQDLGCGKMAPTQLVNRYNHFSENPENLSKDAQSYSNGHINVNDEELPVIKGDLSQYF